MLSYTRFGRGRDLIFLHGWGCNGKTLLPLAQAFAAEFTVTLVDFYGFGGTPFPQKDLTLQDYVLGVVQIIRAHAMPEVVLIGHSFGGRVAIKLARDYPAYVSRIVLIDAAGMRPRRKLGYYFKIFKHKINKKLGRIDTLGSADYLALPSEQRATFVNIVNTHLEGCLPFITAPVLLLWGAKDTATPLYMCKRMLRRLPQARAVVFENAGHFSFIEEKAQTIAEIKAYIGDDDGYFDNNSGLGFSRRNRTARVKRPSA